MHMDAHVDDTHRNQSAIDAVVLVERTTHPFCIAADTCNAAGVAARDRAIAQKVGVPVRGQLARRIVVHTHLVLDVERVGLGVISRRDGRQLHS